MHLNVPAPDQTKVKDIWLNTRWIFTGIYATELVVFAAWRQWCSARLLQTIVTSCPDSSQSSDSETDSNDKRPDQFEWTMTHGFFACTGGFAFDIDGFAPVDAEKDDQEGRLPRRLTLTAKGVALLARCGRLPRVDRGDIEDKSKANNLAKAAVVTQATWLLIQVIGRLAAGLTVTLLEVNTVAHVYVLLHPFSEHTYIFNADRPYRLCAFAMYAFWWPLLPNQPIIIRDRDLQSLAAFMYSSIEMSGYVNPK